MAFSRGSFRAPAAPRIRAAVFAVGGRVYVACASGQSDRVMLTDADDKPLATLGDGTEVVILAWIPGWSGAARYRVRATDSGVEGWLPVGNLRGAAAAASSAPAGPPASALPSGPHPSGEPGGSGQSVGRRRL